MKGERPIHQEDANAERLNRLIYRLRYYMKSKATGLTTNSPPLDLRVSELRELAAANLNSQMLTPEETAYLRAELRSKVEEARYDDDEPTAPGSDY